MEVKDLDLDTNKFNMCILVYIWLKLISILCDYCNDITYDCSVGLLSCKTQNSYWQSVESFDSVCCIIWQM